MNDQELNEKIAVKRGWTHRTLDINGGIELWTSPHGMNCAEEEIPDYCNSWQWAGELLDNLKPEGVELSYGPNHDFTPTINQWCVHFPNWNVKNRGIITFADLAQRAISEAWDEVNP